MRRRPFCGGIVSSIGMMILILDSQTAVMGAREGLTLCTQSLIPTLFPFFVLTSFLTSSLLGTDLPFLKHFRKIMGIPVGCESIMIPAFLGGYPAGAQCIGQSYRDGNLPQLAAQKLLLFCNNAGPSFLFGILGPIFPEKHYLWTIWMIQILSAILCSLIFAGSGQESSSVTKKEPSLTVALNVSLRGMASVCGWVILFRMIIAFLHRWFLWRLPAVCQVILMGSLELTNGCCALILIEDIRIRYLICSAMLSFGGLCVTMQTASAIGNLSIYPYVLAKLLQSIYCILLSTVILYSTIWPLPIIVILHFSMKKIVAFSGFLMYNEKTNSRRTLYAVSKENRARLCILSARNHA